MKHLLVIAYYFPPMGLSGVQRITKFVKYLPAYGWRTTVLTVAPGGYFAFDEALMRDLDQPEINIHRTQAFDPTRFFRKQRTIELPKEASRKRLSGLSQLLFVPDNKIGWYRIAVKKALQLHKEKPFDGILATAPPYTCGLIARRVSKQCNIPFVLDLRDDWLENPRHHYPTILHQKAHKRLESSVFNAASSIITVNGRIADAIRGRHPNRANIVSVIDQGFDPEDFETAPSIPNAAPETLHFLYSGVFYDRQKPDYFLEALSRVVRENPETSVKAHFAGLVPHDMEALVERFGLHNHVVLHGYVDHDIAIAHLKRADVLWMTVGSGPGQEQISTSKLFEYFGAQKPILGLVPEGAARHALSKCKAAFIAPPEDVEAIEAQIRLIYAQWKESVLKRPGEAFVAQYNRRLLAGALADLLREALKT
ncbi:MAG: glycosyltransferase [Bacteroidota bacterium]